MAGRNRPETRPRDASMSLLNNLFSQSLEPGYAQAAARRRSTGEQDGGDRTVRSRVSVALVIGMLALGLLLAMAIVQAQGSVGVVSAEREGLIERIRGEEAKTERLQDSLASLRSEISELEDTQLRQTSTGQSLRERLQLLQGAAGTSAVAGPGIAVVLDDAEDIEAAERPDLARVLDVDLQMVANGLWAAGAEAISINGERLTTMSAIRMANNIIHINQQPLKPPYAVWAIGDSRTLPSRFSEGPGGDTLRVAQQQGVRSAVRVEEWLELPAARSQLIYARHAEEAS
ncbi:DUF881 domain-containing protein [Phytoactinopolyspora limicola]|uniref:DUF881 domain-containing protein n=1 Tax=Phytoactinopolyspora limicola TaxID=2715536 RepID=UPI00140D831C|nr:DUF881 domain-containing protein [Phytoactinopolyspora limicola]